MGHRLPATLAALASLGSLPVFAEDAITIYSTAVTQVGRHGGRNAAPGYAVVRHDRPVELKAGRNELKFTDVAAQIDPTTVWFSSLTDPEGTRVIEQSFQFDLVSTEKLLERFLDREIAVERLVGDRIETIEGTLLSARGGITLREADGAVRTVPYNAGVKLPNLPGGLITRPTLVWDVATRQPGAHRARVTYQTAGLGWWTDYNLTLSEAGGCRLDVGAWVSILNQSGATYTDAKVKLVAGDVHRAEFKQQVPMAAMAQATREADDEMRGFEEKQFFEYHLYTLGRSTTLPDNSTKQIELFPAAKNVVCDKTLVYYGQAGLHYGHGSVLTDRNLGFTANTKVDVYLRFKNSEANGMGVPLPAGRVRVAKADDADGSLEFIGEDRIDHTPKNETIQLMLGNAFDVVGSRRQMDFRVDSNRNTMTEEIEVKLRNSKDQPVRVIVKENLYRWTNWKITQANHSWERQDSRTIHFPVEVPSNGETTVRYTVRYTW
ncbi:MAG TPA: hypothetical protein VNM24_00895 [Burkholderiales bacterium]|nr:hypothetical protein [Burkholderiales bacterium]